MKVLVFISSYNDSFFIPKIIEELIANNEPYTILLIDDGSKEKLHLKDVNSKVVLFRIPFNAGLGVTTNIALNIARSCDFDFLVRLDADGQHPTCNVKKILDQIGINNYEVCIGERINNEKITSFRDFLASIIKRHIRFLSNKLTGNNINDWNTGFFCLNRLAICKLSKYRYARYPEVEMFLYAHQLNLKISTLYIKQLDRLCGKSTLNLFQAFRLLVRFYMNFMKQFL